MAVEAPRVKRVKYVTLVFLSKPGTSATNTVYRYNLTESFSVLVGTGPSRQHFTVHHELITQRSEFFRAARSARWTKRKKATKLVDDKPHIFSAYLNCLYLGAGFMIKQPKTDNIEGSAAEVEEAKKITKAKDQETLEFFVELYLLADKLLVPGTANLVIDEHISFVDRTLQQLGVPPLPEGEGRAGVLGWLHSVARSHVDVALAHRPVLIANALGSPPVDVIEKAHEHGVAVAALAGAMVTKRPFCTWVIRPTTLFWF